MKFIGIRDDGTTSQLDVLKWNLSIDKYRTHLELVIIDNQLSLGSYSNLFQINSDEIIVQYCDPCLVSGIFDWKTATLTFSFEKAETLNYRSIVEDYFNSNNSFYAFLGVENLIEYAIKNNIPF